MPSHKQVRDTIHACVAKIRTADGYETNIDVIRTGSSPILDLRQDNLPNAGRAMILFHGNDYEWGPGHRVTVTASYSVTVTFTTNNDDPSLPTAEEQAMKIVSDMEKMIGFNNQAGGIDEITLQSSSTDAGYATPEATVLFELSVLYRKS